MKKTKGVSLIELSIAIVMGIILMISVTSILIWVFKMQVFVLTGEAQEQILPQ